jgi:KaiC/GvpD/RAD55 family RecA-like ATPase
VSTYADNFAGAVQTGDLSRSAKDLSFAIFLVRKGLTPDEIGVILSNTEYNKGKDLKEKYLERTIAKAMETFEQDGASNTDKTMRAEHKSKQTSSAEVSPVGSSPVLLKYSEIQNVVYPPVERFRTNIRCIDDYTDGGLGLTELSLFVAEKASGKSTIACWIGVAAQQQGYNVLHVFYEDRLSNLKSRYDHNFIDRSFDSEVFFCDATERPIRVPQIEAAIRQCNPGLVIIDYLARIPEVKDDRFSVRDIIFKFGNMARQYNTHILVTDHVTVEKPPTDRFGNAVSVPYVLEDYRLSEAKMYKSMATDIMIGLMRDRYDRSRVWVTGMKMKLLDNELKNKSIQVDWKTGKYTG